MQHHAPTRLRRTAGGVLAGLVVATAGLTALTTSPATADPDPHQVWVTSITLDGPSSFHNVFTLSDGNGGTTVQTGGPNSNTVTNYTGTFDSLLEPDPPSGTQFFNTGLNSGGSQQIAVHLNAPVKSLNVHALNLDGSSLTVGGTSTTGDAIAVTPVSGNELFDVNGNTINDTVQPANSGGCRPISGAANNGACGTVHLSAANGALQDFTLTQTEVAHTGDGFQWSLSYDGNLPPTATVNAPADGATYFEGQTVPADYTCADADGTVASCDGPVAAGSSIDTSSTGAKTFTVTATDDSGASTATTSTYKVVPVVGLCRGTAIGLPLSINLSVANPATSPCATGAQGPINVNTTIGNPGVLATLNNTIKANALTATSTRGVGSAAATAGVATAGIKLPSLGIEISLDAVQTSATSQLTSCDKPATLTSSSTVGTLKLNGVPIVVGSQPLSVPLLVGGLYLNQNVVAGNTVTRRAVFLDLPGDALDVVVAESKAGVVCGS